MNKTISAAVAGLTAMASVLSATPATAQSRWHDSDRDGRPDSREWNRDRDRDGRPDSREWNRDRDRDGRWDRHDNRNHRWSYYGGNYGYHGYRGRWRTGQRFPYYNNNRYVITDYRSYDLPPPRRGYRYYRDDSGDIVMAAIGSGIIGLILGSQLR